MTHGDEQFSAPYIPWLEGWRLVPERTWYTYAWGQLVAGSVFS